MNTVRTGTATARDGVSGEPLSGEWDAIDDAVAELFALVGDGLGWATQAFLDSDRESARHLAANEQLIDSVYGRAELLARQQLVSGGDRAEARLRRLLVVLQVVPELERSGDLVEHIAMRAAQGLARNLTPKCRGLIGSMGKLGVDMWRAAADAYLMGDATAAIHLRAWDDELDDLHVQLTAELAAAPIPIAVAIEMGLVARFFERLGDHAVNVTKRLESLV